MMFNLSWRDLVWGIAIALVIVAALVASAQADGHDDYRGLIDPKNPFLTAEHKRVHDRTEARQRNERAQAIAESEAKLHAKINASNKHFSGVANHLKSVQEVQAQALRETQRRTRRAFERVFDLQAANVDIVRADGNGLQLHGGIGGNMTGGGGTIGLSYQTRSGVVVHGKAVIGIRHADALGQVGVTIPLWSPED